MSKKNNSKKTLNFVFSTENTEVEIRTMLKKMIIEKFIASLQL